MLPKDLVKHNCLQYAYQTTGASGNFCIVKTVVPTTISTSCVFQALSTDNATALRKAALGGHGAYVPRCLVYHDIRNGQLVDIFPQLVGKKLGIYAVYPFTLAQLRPIRLSC